VYYYYYDNDNIALNIAKSKISIESPFKLRLQGPTFCPNLVKFHRHLLNTFKLPIVILTHVVVMMIMRRRLKTLNNKQPEFYEVMALSVLIYRSRKRKESAEMSGGCILSYFKRNAEQIEYL
jgi:hypothetical protein